MKNKTLKSMNFNKLRGITAVLLAAVMLTACGGGQKNAAAPDAGAEAVPVQDTKVQETKEQTPAAVEQTPVQEETKQAVITDREGNEITVPEKMDSIVSMAPSITETLVHLGLADRLVAVDTYSAQVEGVPEGLPVYDMMTPDTENLAVLKPDIIFATGMSKSKGEDPFSPVTKLGVMMTYIPSATDIEGIKEDIRFLGELTGTKAKAESIIADLEKEMEEVLAQIQPTKEKRKVYFEIAAAPDIYTFGKGTFLNEMIQLLGGENIFSDQEGWISASEESVLSNNPDIIFTNVDYIENPIDEIMNRNGWDAVNAVKEKAVYQIDKNTSSHPNEYAVGAFRQLAQAMYPGSFK